MHLEKVSIVPYVLSVLRIPFERITFFSERSLNCISSVIYQASQKKKKKKADIYLVGTTQDSLKGGWNGWAVTTERLSNRILKRATTACKTLIIVETEEPFTELLPETLVRWRG